MSTLCSDPFSYLEIELDGQLASERAGSVHNPAYVTHHACKICTAILEREWEVWKENLLYRSGKFIHSLPYFCSLSFILHSQEVHSLAWVFCLCCPCQEFRKGELYHPVYSLTFFVMYTLFLLKKIFFIVIQLQLYAFSPHPSTPPQLNPPPSPTSILPFDFVHVPFIVVPIIHWS